MNEQEGIDEMLRAVFGELLRDGEPGFVQARDEFVFHMTDWLDDLEQLVALFRRRDVPTDVATRPLVATRQFPGR
ncbi:MAG: hypothetical protein H0U13_15905 [Gemmatimonadaceae bacterium]|nr:hypothetical protein [Gemmatimonadaceae bacterium]